MTGFINSEITKGEFNTLSILIQVSNFEVPAWFQAQSEVLRFGLILKMTVKALTDLGDDAASRFNREGSVTKLLAVTKARKNFKEAVIKAHAHAVAMPTERLPGLEESAAGTLDTLVCDMTKIFDQQLNDDAYSDFARFAASQKLSTLLSSQTAMDALSQGFHQPDTSWKKDLAASEDVTIGSIMEAAEGTILDLKGAAFKSGWEKLTKDCFTAAAAATLLHCCMLHARINWWLTN